MDDIIEFLESFASFCETALDFFQSVLEYFGMIIEGQLWLTLTLPKFVSQITALFAYCPPFLGVFLVASFMIIVTYAVIKLI